jgi:ABC-type amino acid transport substrate-binding protein
MTKLIQTVFFSAALLLSVMGGAVYADDDDHPEAAVAKEAPQQSGGDDSWSRIQTQKLIRVGVYRDFAPFHTDEKGGIDDDIGAEVAKRLGLKVSIQSYRAGDEMEDDFRVILVKGHYLGIPRSDLMLHVPQDPMLAKETPQIVLRAPYATEEMIVAYDKEKMSSWKGLESLGGLRVGVETQSMPDLYVLSFGAAYRDKVDHFKRLTEAVDAMKKGDVQVVIGSRTKVMSAIGTDEQNYAYAKFNAGVYGKPLTLGVALRKEDRELADKVDQALKEMVSDGAMAKIYAKHHAQWIAP